MFQWGAGVDSSTWWLIAFFRLSLQLNPALRSVIRILIQDNAGRKTFSIFFKKDRFSYLMSFNFENAVSHKYVVQKSKRL